MSSLKKYGRTLHLPWSPGATSDDKRHTLNDIKNMFFGLKVVVTEKMDGENTTIYADGTFHARSVDSVMHPSRTRIAALAARIATIGMPKGWRIIGENVYAKHSIFYDRLPDYFLVFNIIDENNKALTWSKVKEWASLLDLHTVPEFYSGTFRNSLTKPEGWADVIPTISTFSSENAPEGYVVRLAGEFSMDDIESSLSKYVRANHVQTDSHWMNSKIIPNALLER